VGSRLSLKITKKVHSTQTTSNKVYQLLAHGRWFSPGTPAYSTTKTGRHEIAEILLKVALNTKNQSSQIKTQLLNIDGIIMYVYFLEPLVLLS